MTSIYAIESGLSCPSSNLLWPGLKIRGFKWERLGAYHIATTTMVIANGCNFSVGRNWFWSNSNLIRISFFFTWTQESPCKWKRSHISRNKAHTSEKGARTSRKRWHAQSSNPESYVRIVAPCFSDNKPFSPNPYLHNLNTNLVQMYMRFNFQV